MSRLKRKHNDNDQSDPAKCRFGTALLLTKRVTIKRMCAGGMRRPKKLVIYEYSANRYLSITYCFLVFVYHFLAFYRFLISQQKRFVIVCEDLFLSFPKTYYVDLGALPLVNGIVVLYSTIPV